MINELINSTLVNLSILVKDTLSKCPDKIELGNFPFPVLNEVLEDLGWEIDKNAGIDTNGWEVDYWILYTHPKYNFKYNISGSLFYGNLKIEKE